MTDQNFTGDKKVPLTSLLAAPEKRFITWLTPKFPACIEGYHLTLMTIPWSIGLVLFGYWAKRYSLHFLHLSSLMLFLQWFTDCFDGSLGRYRDTGIPKWGFYMDHFLDYIFMPAAFIGWSFLFEDANKQLMWFLVIAMGSLMVNSFLEFGSTGQFRITYLRTGPTEMRLAFILINTFIAFAGIECLVKPLPYIFTAFWVGVIVVVYRTQRYIWQIDMADKASRDDQGEVRT